MPLGGALVASGLRSVADGGVASGAVGFFEAAGMVDMSRKLRVIAVR
jgi:hypothetical protein